MKTTSTILAALTLAAIAGCSSNHSDDGGGASGPGAGGQGASDPAGGGGSSPTALGPFEAWAEMREAFRMSPDHLAEEAARVVASSDQTLIHAFVRDRIATIPGEATSIGSSAQRRWGTRGTLRSGTGTVRDRAELLKNLYTQAGFQAEVVVGSVAVAGEQVSRNLLLSSATTAVATGASIQDRDRWLTALGAQPQEPQWPDHTGADTATLANAIDTLLGDALTLPTFSFDPPLDLPLVRFKAAESPWIFASLEPGVGLGELGSVVSPDVAPDADLLPIVAVELLVSTSGAPNQMTPVAAGAWSVDTVVGRTVLLQTLPAAPFEQVLAATLGQVRSFVPTISVQIPDASFEEAEGLTAVGDVFTASGDIFQTQIDDSVTVAGVPLVTTPPDAEAADAVTSLTVEPFAGAFPNVRARVTALDADGESVSGLGASNFALTENGASLGFVLLENAPPPPRVLFLIDKSSSMPDAFAGTEVALLAKEMATDILTQAPGATFLGLAVGENLGTVEWIDSPTALEESINGQLGYESDLWAAHALAASLQPTVVITITDGVASDTPTEESSGAIGSMCPAILLLAGAETSVDADDIAALSGGKVLAVTDHQEAIAAATAALAARQMSAYLLRYTAPLSGPSERNVQVSMVTGTAAGNGTYTVPTSPTPPPHLTGLYARITVGSDEPLVRTIVSAADASSPEMGADRVRAALFGTTQLHFEPGSPTTSAALDDVLTARLGLEPLFDAVTEGDAPKVLAALKDGLPALPTAALAVAAPLDLGLPDARVSPSGLRATLEVVQPVFGQGMLRRTDVTTLGPYFAAAETQAAARAAVLKATARIALREGFLFEASTAKDLSGAPLILLLPYQAIDEGVDGLDADAIGAWGTTMKGFEYDFKLVPASGSPVAFWAIDDATGSLTGVRQGGGGEGVTIAELETTLSDVTRMLDLVGVAAGRAGAGLGFGVWLSLEQTKANKVISASIVLLGGTPEDDPSDLVGAGAEAGCNAALGGVSTVAGEFGPWGSLLGAGFDAVMDASTVSGAVGGPSLDPCGN